jgi:hypothetical protein
MTAAAGMVAAGMEEAVAAAREIPQWDSSRPCEFNATAATMFARHGDVLVRDRRISNPPCRANPTQCTVTSAVIRRQHTYTPTTLDLPFIDH